MKKMPVLPVEAYTSQDWFDKEQELIFGNTWQYAGMIEDIQDPGDYVTVQCGKMNIVITMGNDMRLRAFHNICRHRGTELLRAVGKKQKAITCPYHDWTYNLTGELISVPEEDKEFPNLDKKKFCLHKASVDIWKGMIMVHPKPNAMPINQWFEGTAEYLGPHKPEELTEYPDTYYEKIINANWKIVAENYIDVYHLAHLHSETLNMYDHANAEYGFVGPHYMFWEPLAKFYEENLEDLTSTKIIKRMENEPQMGTYVPWLFPNIGLAESESAWSNFIAIPIAPDKTKVIVRSKVEEMTEYEFYSRNKKATKSWGKFMTKTKYGNEDENDPMASMDFMEEDVFACESQQKALTNPMFSVGITAQHGESTVRQFQQIVAEYMNV